MVFPFSASAIVLHPSSTIMLPLLKTLTSITTMEILSYHFKIKICDCGIPLQCLGNDFAPIVSNSIPCDLKNPDELKKKRVKKVALPRRFNSLPQLSILSLISSYDRTMARWTENGKGVRAGVKKRKEKGI